MRRRLALHLTVTVAAFAAFFGAARLAGYDVLVSVDVDPRWQVVGTQDADDRSRCAMRLVTFKLGPEASIDAVEYLAITITGPVTIQLDDGDAVYVGDKVTAGVPSVKLARWVERDGQLACVIEERAFR